jgi:single-strand DNA-binding protein
MEIITGKVTANAIVKNVNGRDVINFSIAVNDNYKNKAGETVSKVKFYDCGYWSSSKLSEYLTKGKIVQLYGDTFAKAWQDKEGKLHAGLGFHVYRIKLLGGGTTKKEDDVIIDPPAETNGNVDDLPF